MLSQLTETRQINYSVLNPNHISYSFSKIEFGDEERRKRRANYKKKQRKELVNMKGKEEKEISEGKKNSKGWYSGVFINNKESN